MKGWLVAFTLTVATAALPARADSGRLNLHSDFGLGGAVAGPGSFQRAGDERSIGGLVGLGLDYELVPPIAIETLFMAGGFTKAFPTSDRTGSSLVGISFGARFRFLDDDLGYLGEHGGNARGNLYASAHIGLYSFDSIQYGFDFTVGYELSVHRPVSVGPMVRLLTLVGGSNEGADVVLLAGVSASLEAIPRPAGDDTDHDGLDDDDERRRGTNPREADTDTDGLSDRLEVDYDTDPLVADTDTDGLADGFEDQNGNGLLDLDETDPRNLDTDEGGISDGDELMSTRTDPRDRRDDDSDSDGVPNDADSCANTPSGSPVDHAGCPARQAEPEIAQIAFVAGRSRISPEGEAALTILARSMGSGRTRIRAYVLRTTNGTADAALSSRRAEVLATWFVEHDVPRERFSIESLGGDEVEGRTTDPNALTLQIVRD